MEGDGMADRQCLRCFAHVAVRWGRARAAAVPCLILCLLSVALTACMGYDIEAVRDLKPDTGDSYTDTLAEEYRRIALYEADEMYDWIDAGHFAVKGLEAGAGTEVEPEELADWRLPEASVPQLQEARQTLLGALENRAAGDEAGQLVARAQASFDCWVEQQEEDHQPDDIATCRDSFYSNLSRLSALLEMRSKAVTSPAALPVPPAGTAGGADVPVAVALFAFDSAALDAAAESEIAAAVRAATRLPEAAVVVVGHTDRVGSDAYNLNLSLRRAEAVRDALVARGVAAERIDIIGRGEWDPAVPTADEVAEPANRRAEIFILPDGGTPPLSSQQTEIRIAPAGASAMEAAPRPVSGCGVPAEPPAEDRELWGGAVLSEMETGPSPCPWRAPNRPFLQQSRRSDTPAAVRVRTAGAEPAPDCVNRLQYPQEKR
jgi:OOP family OmpA-OmpF porin